MRFIDNLRTNIWIYISILLSIILTAFVIWFAYIRDESNASVDDTKRIVEQKILEDDLIRARAELVDQDKLRSIIDEQNIEYDVLLNDFKELGSKLSGVNVVSVITPGKISTNLPSTDSKPKPGEQPQFPDLLPCVNGTCINPDKYGYLNNSSSFKINEPFDKEFVPFGEMTFSAWQENPWGETIYPREYKAVTILSTDSTGRHYVHNQFIIKTEGKEYKLPIQESEFHEMEPKAEFRVSPRLYLGLDAGVSVPRDGELKPEVIPNVQISVFNYGQYEDSPDWTFLGIGVGYASARQEAAVIVTPVTYNLGQHIPLMKNMQIGPSVSVDTGVNFTFGGGLRVGF